MLLSLKILNFFLSMCMLFYTCVVWIYIKISCEKKQRATTFKHARCRQKRKNGRTNKRKILARSYDIIESETPLAPRLRSHVSPRFFFCFCLSLFFFFALSPPRHFKALYIDFETRRIGFTTTRIDFQISPY